MRFSRVFIFVAAVALCSSVGAQAAVSFLWPRNGSVVRESVNVAIDARGVPDGAYVTFYLNDHFMSAVGVSSTISGGRKAYTWVWDTRNPVNLGQPNDQPKRPIDGLYTLKARVVESSGGSHLIGESMVNVRLANKVTSVSAESPISLTYSYTLGQTRKYAVRVGVTLREVGGAEVDSGRELQTVSYTGLASVEDVQSPGLAVMRYHPSNTSFKLLGESLGKLPSFEAGSLYELVDAFGRVRERDLFSTAGVYTDPTFGVDYRTPLPHTPVRAGDRWTAPLEVSMPALGDAKVDATLTFDSLEWAGGRETAKIDTVIKGSAQASVAGLLERARQQMDAQAAAAQSTGQTPTEESAFGPAPVFGSGLGGPSLGAAGGSQGTAPASVSGSGSDWFAYRSGVLIRRELNADLEMTVDSGSLDSLLQGLGIANPQDQSAASANATGKPNTGAYEQPEEYMQDLSSALGRAFGRTRSSTGPAEAGIKIKLRVSISARLLS
ncbi:MAG: hypothetical protein IT209_11800 [Armatimonadetes bacterium]|nr:hypothetical protein [Armatimonadota bacterium]